MLEELRREEVSCQSALFQPRQVTAARLEINCSLPLRVRGTAQRQRRNSHVDIVGNIVTVILIAEVAHCVIGRLHPGRPSSLLLQGRAAVSDRGGRCKAASEQEFAEGQPSEGVLPNHRGEFIRLIRRSVEPTAVLLRRRTGVQWNLK